MNQQQLYTSFIEKEHAKYKKGSMTEEEYNSYLFDLQRLRNFRISSVIGPNQPYQGVSRDERK